MYGLIKPLLFKLDAETAHNVTLKLLKLANTLKLSFIYKKSYDQPVECMGLTFKNPIGLAAGLDKNGDYIDALADLGFGFIEIGTITPKPQKGNPRPRLFRLEREKAIINRMGFNSLGIKHALKNLQKKKYNGILGINIGKNKETPNEKAIDDYIIGFKAFVPYASYITVNISSPNTPGLRQLQEKDFLPALLKALKAEQADYQKITGKYVPLVVKVAPDLTDEEIKIMEKTFIDHQIDGVIATNTTISRDGIDKSIYKDEAGGLSGEPVQHASTATIQNFNKYLQNRIPIIGCGGIVDTKSAEEKRQVGAQLLQVYTGLIYEGPELVARIIKGL